jgi:hypothetical protein
LVCQLGRINDCQTEEGNCFTDGDQPMWNGSGNVAFLHPEQQHILRSHTCAGISAEYAAHNLTLEANENYLIAAGLCPMFWNAVAFRDPIARLISHLSMLADPNNYWHAWAHNITSNVSLRRVFDDFPLLSNNFFIRSLLGEEVYRLPFGTITWAHMEQAKTVLEGFDVILVADEDNNAYLERDIRSTLGFQVVDEDIDGVALDGGTDAQASEGARREGATDEFQQRLQWTSADWKSLQEANALDLELWKHAQALHSIDRQVFLHPTFLKVSSRMPRTRCGFLCK